MLINILIIMTLIGMMGSPYIATAQELNTSSQDPDNIEISEISTEVYYSLPGESQHDMILRLFGWDLKILQDKNQSKVLRL